MFTVVLYKANFVRVHKKLQLHIFGVIGYCPADERVTFDQLFVLDLEEGIITKHRRFH